MKNNVESDPDESSNFTNTSGVNSSSSGSRSPANATTNKSSNPSKQKDDDLSNEENEEANSTTGAKGSKTNSEITLKNVEVTKQNEAVGGGACVGDPEYDQWCDPADPKIVPYVDIYHAATRIRPYVIQTVCTKSHALSELLGMELFFKKEFLQVTGSFKERGARNTLLCLNEEERKRGVTAASAGNHALGLSYHGKLMGIRITVVMPVNAPLAKISLCKKYGANVILKGQNITESKSHALRLSKQDGSNYVNGYDHPHIIAGQGTCGKEILEQVENVDAILVPVGGGGLIAGVAAAVKHISPDTLIIGIEPEYCSSFTKAIEVGHPEKFPAVPTVADGLNVALVGVNAFAVASNLIDKMISVNESEIVLAMLRLLEYEKAVLEGAGAVGVAALLAGKLPQLKGKRVVAILTGGNIDTTVIGRVIDRGLAIDRRLIRVSLEISDKPGGLAQLAKFLYKLGASIKNIHFEGPWVKSDVFAIRVKLLLETKDSDHATEIETALQAKFLKVHLNPNL